MMLPPPIELDTSVRSPNMRSWLPHDCGVLSRFSRRLFCGGRVSSRGRDLPQRGGLCITC